MYSLLCIGTYQDNYIAKVLKAWSKRGLAPSCWQSPRLLDRGNGRCHAQAREVAQAGRGRELVHGMLHDTCEPLATQQLASSRHGKLMPEC